MQEAIIRRRPANLSELEQEMNEFIGSQEDEPGDLGTLSAQAVLMQYEAAAKSSKSSGSKSRIASASCRRRWRNAIPTSS